MAKRKIGFYYLSLRTKENGVEVDLPIKENLESLVAHLLTKTPVERKHDMSNDKFVFMDSSTKSQETDDTMLLSILFKSAKHSYRAPLLNRNTVVARENPKTMLEGEQMKTHCLIKFKEGCAILFLETGQNMLTCNNITEYLNNSLTIYNSEKEEDDRIVGKFCFDMIPRDDFSEVLASMSRVTLAEIYTDKEILGGEYLNFANPSEEMKDTVVMSVKAERGKNIIQCIYNFLDNLGRNGSKIKRIRVKGKLPNDNESIIDTSFIIKKEFIETQQNEDTGEFNSVDMFKQLKLLSRDY
jgi:hypothetical protein